MRKTRKKFFLVFCFVVSLILALGFPRQIVASNNIPNIPTVLENIDGYSVEVPDWSQITWSSMPGFAEAGSIDFPMDVVNQLGYDPSRIWKARANVSDVLMLGDISSMGVSGFALQQISNLSGINLDILSLNDFTAMNWQSISSLTLAIPGLENIPIANIQVFSDLIGNEGVGNLLDAGRTVGDVLNIAPEIGEIPLGDALDLNKYALIDSIPALEFTSLESFKDWERSLISQVPGLDGIPLSQFLSFNPELVQIALISQVWGDSERGDPQVNDSFFVSGKTSKMSTTPVACKARSNCAYLELADPIVVDGPFYGKRWVSGDTQQVEGGYGVLKTLNGGKQPTGRAVFSDLFQTVVLSPSEPNGSATLALFLPACAPQLNSCSPKFIGPIPLMSVKENDPILMFGGTTARINIPSNFQGQIDDILGQYMPGFGGDFPICTGDDCPTPGEINQAIVQSVERLGKFNTGYGYSPAATEGGKKACMFAVNKVLAEGGVRPLANGSLAVRAARADLAAGRGQLLNQSQAVAGDLVIVDAGGSSQHIGICMNNGCTRVRSNSSSRASFSWDSNPGFRYQGSPYNGGSPEFWRVTN